MILGRYIKSADRNLTAEGYQIYPSAFRPELVQVVKPNNGGVYNVDVTGGTCTCQAGRRGVKCCHLREAIAKVQARPLPVVMTSAGFGNREAFEKARSLDFD